LQPKEFDTSCHEPIQVYAHELYGITLFDLVGGFGDAEIYGDGSGCIML